MLAKLIHDDNANSYLATIFDEETSKYRLITFEQETREYAEEALKSLFPDIRITNDNAIFAQWIAELPAKIAPERMDKFTWNDGDIEFLAANGNEEE